MENEYRIKEVTIPWKDGNKTTVFYPQVKRERVIISGHFWWKKTTREDAWVCFYHKSDTSTFTSKKIFPKDAFIGEVDGYYYSDEAVYFDTKEWAQNFINNFDNKELQKSKDYYPKYKAMNWADERYVKIHPITNNKTENHE